MPRRSKVMNLPNDVRSELDRRLVEGGFQNYDGLSDWLTVQGYEISTSSVHRYGQQFEDRLSMLRIATEQARAITESMGDDAGALGEALTAVAQEKAFQVLLDMSAEDAADVSFDKLVTSIAKLNQAGVQQKRWATAVREKAQAAAAEVEAITRAAGLSDDAAAQIRSKILGIAV